MPETQASVEVRAERPQSQSLGPLVPVLAHAVPFQCRIGPSPTDQTSPLAKPKTSFRLVVVLLGTGVQAVLSQCSMVPLRAAIHTSLPLLPQMPDRKSVAGLGLTRAQF